MSFDVQRSGSPLRGISYDEAHKAVIAGFQQWLNADCGGGLGPSITISDYGPVECRKAEYNQDSPNANIIMFRDDDWPYANAIDTLALTTLIFNADNGQIYDADVEVNTFQSPPPPAAPVVWVTSADRAGTGIDFASVITHELGDNNIESISNRSTVAVIGNDIYRNGSDITIRWCTAEGARCGIKT